MIKRSKRREKRERKIFIKETIGTRKYFSYRSDMALIKLIISLAAFIMLYFITSEILISVIMAVQIFVLLTLINRIALKRKENEGREALIGKAKKDWFMKKIKTMNSSYFEDLAVYFFRKEGWKNLKNCGKGSFTAIENDETVFMKVIRFYDEAEVEKIDLRNLISEMNAKNICKGYLVSVNEMGEEAAKETDKLKSKLTVNFVKSDDLYKLACKYNLLPDDKAFCERICDETISKEKGGILMNSVFNWGKTGTYILSSLFFFIMSVLMSGNSLNKYIGIYFLLLAVGCITAKLALREKQS